MIERDEVKESIINISRSIFTRFGFKKTTVDEIALASRKGKSSIYYYFESKEDIFKAVVEKEAEMLNEEIFQATCGVENPMQKLKIHVLTRMRTMQKLSNMYSALKDDYLSHLGFIDMIRRNYDQEEIRMMENILEEGCKSGDFQIEDTHLAAVAIVTALKGLEIPLFWGHEENDTERRLDNLVHILFHGVLKR